MLTLVAGIVIGVAFGLIVMGFIAIGSYDRGYDAARYGGDPYAPVPPSKIRYRPSSSPTR